MSPEWSRSAARMLYAVAPTLEFEQQQELRAAVAAAGSFEELSPEHQALLQPAAQPE